MDSARPDSALVRAAAAAWEWLHQGRWQAAVEGFERALALIPAQQPGAGAAALLLQRALVVGRSEAQTMLGHQDQAECELRRSFAHVLPPRVLADPMDAMEARALLGLGRLRLLARQPGEAAAVLEQALAALPPAEPVGSRWSELRARLQQALATCRCTEGRVEESLPLFEQALTVFEHPLHADLTRDLAGALLNCGNAHIRLGRLAAARDHMGRGLDLLSGLANAGSPRDRASVAMAEMNLAVLHVEAADVAAALPLYAASAAHYEHEIKRATGRGDVTRLRTSRAMVEMNWAHALFLAGDNDAAVARFRSARSRYRALHMAAPHVAEDEAQVWVNQAHLLLRQQQPAAAQRLYARAWKSLGALHRQGRGHLDASVANAQLGLARALALQGRAAAAASHFHAAQAVLVQLTELGQLMHAPAWGRALAEHVDALLGGGAVGSADGQALLQALAHPPRHTRHDLGVQLHGIDSALDRLASWLARGATTPWLGAVAVAFVRHLLDRAALMLGDSEPAALREYEARSRQVVARLRRAARALPQEPLLLADWFVRTRGLRAQRSALAAGRDPRLMTLRADLAQLRRLEEDMLAQAPAVGAGVDAGRAAQWLQLHDRCDASRARWVKAGLLPAALRLDAGSLAANMPPRRALIMLARGEPGELLAIALRRSHGSDSGVHVLAMQLEPDLAAIDGVQANRRLRQAMRLQTGSHALRRGADSAALDMDGGGPADPDAVQQTVRRLYEAVAQQALAPLVQALALRGIEDFALVPSADLHLLPYNDLLAATLAQTGARLSVYPNCGAWAQCSADTRRRARRLPPVWAVLSHSGGDGSAPLHWVVLEQSLTMTLWSASKGGAKLLNGQAPLARGVNALIGMGHGHAPDDNPARAGLLIGPDQVLSAHDLPGLRACRHALLSCCILGCTDEVHTEAMGFLSTGFGYQLRFGAGWLIEVPDAEACLFSLAFQYALRSACAAVPRQRLRWAGLFETVRQGVAAGRWPDGFGAWLHSHLPQAVADAPLPPGRWLNRYEYLRDFDGGLFASPPPSLRRLMPWVTALGE